MLIRALKWEITTGFNIINLTWQMVFIEFY